ncbi:MAG: 3-deoxy-manno-octulosonate cytidylyltransferase [bacterium]|nr:3-deoxy-manno-octulosonate cytidylyltransferase [bacterium]
MKVIGVIPARIGSTRLPKKPLELILGKPMIQWVWEGAKKSKLLNELIVATDDKSIVKAVEGFGGNAVLTPASCQSGSDRIAKAVSKLKADIVVNIQGDEPLMTGPVVDQAIKALIKHPEAVVGTVCKEIKDPEDYDNPNAVKVVFNRHGYAIYFSRSRIPATGKAYKHMGIYSYGYDFLKQFTKLKQTPLEIAEKLEQLRILENGFKIGILPVNQTLISVDTKEDLDRVENYLKGLKK